MPAEEHSYENHDKSNQRLRFEDPHFPAYFRLLKWKLLDVCIGSMSFNDIGYFARFEPCIPHETLTETVRKMTEPPRSFTVDPDFTKIKDSGLDEKVRKQSEIYLKMRYDHMIKVQRRRFAEYFLSKVLFNETGLRIADQLMYENCNQVYGTSHWEDLPLEWATTETFLEKFFDEEELEKDPFGMQRLDRVAGSARGMIIMKYLKMNPHCVSEYKLLDKEIADDENLVHTDLVKEILDEGPIYELRKDDQGEEKKYRAAKWNIHKTLIMFSSIPGFRSNDKKLRNEHEEWFYGLLEAMKHDPTNRAALYFLNKNYAVELEEREKERDRQRLQILKGQQINEEAVGEQIFKEIRAQPSESGYNPSIETAELKLRTYQEELVQPALEGKNCVVVAPTGAGKTEVAIYAALNHIKERHNQKKAARVVLLVPKIPLVNQQKERFLKYCAGQYHVCGIHGSEKSDTGEGRRDDVLQAHIVVMTPQILINMLQSVRRNERLYVSDFSMMVFDEVHKTSGNHPYVLINRLVQEWDYEKPQIIGLTASLNVNATAHTELSAMLGNIYTMLALLNTPCLSTITHQASIDELNEHVSKPDDEVEVCQAGENVLRAHIETYLHINHGKLCAELEKLSKSRHNCFPAKTYHMFRKANTKDYEYYDAQLTNIIQDLNKLNTPEKMCAQKWTKYIKVYVEARGIVDVMPAMTAFDYMKGAIRTLDNEHTLTQFSDFFTDRIYEPLRRNSEKVEPPIVQRLKDTLIDQFKKIPDSRVIIFVVQRSTAQRVSDFLNQSGVMDQFRSSGDKREDMVGYVLGTNKQGAVQQSPDEQKTVLGRFNTGKLKVIVATSVVEEGLDVAACNLIIKYNCSSGSAIQLIQQRGRARAKNSRSVLLAVNSKVKEDDNNALISEKFMRLCMKLIEDKGSKQLESEVSIAAARIEKERKNEFEAQQALRNKLDSKIYRLTCTSCSSFFSRSTVVKKVYSNYMLFDNDVWSRFGMESRRKKPNRYLNEETQALSVLKCLSCKSDIGKAYKMRGVYLPQLDVKAVTFAPENHDEGTATRQKWSAVENDLFWIGEATQIDFENMLNALLNTQENMDKKRILDLDSKQHIRDIELKKYRDREAENAARKKRIAEEEARERPVQGKTDFSEDED
ncbi:hypothetical protein B9Z55_001573 [Caenorhabditis nigoni]|uniref:RNA helicase n=1 Tax=Caenorhabditis nigoni TaxID=1611254 RepID=A0A2G5VGB0_9PELO|nr:hypothetical protein B9Z55_001573 [Caenorhabditis nigoni]